MVNKHQGLRFAHITKVHPCFNEKIHDKVGRVHVPIAPKCNIYCNFCTRDINNDEERPGVAACVMDTDGAIEHVNKVTEDGPISVVGVAGPGDSLANKETFEFFKKLGDENPDLIKCMSTNGLLLPKYADEIAKLGVNTVTVTINAVDPEIAKDIYSFINYEGKIYNGRQAAEILIKNQLDGVEKLARKGVVVKVNSVLIPGLNDKHIEKIAKEVEKRGASLMNVLPLIPLNKLKDYPDLIVN
jgi:nitrogen fixation protein NifB